MDKCYRILPLAVSSLCLMILLAFSHVAISANAVSDANILTSSSPVASWEFSADGQHAFFARRASSNPPLFTAFYARALNNGLVRFGTQTNVSDVYCDESLPVGEKKCGFVDPGGTPQVGAGALEVGDPSGASNYYAVYLQKDTKKFVLIRADGDDAEDALDEMSFVPDNCANAGLRKTVTPVRSVFSQEKWAVYTTEVDDDNDASPVCSNRPANTGDTGTCLRLWAVNLEDNDTDCALDHKIIYDEWNSPTAATALEAGFFRWTQDAALLFHGHFAPSLTVAAPPGNIKSVIARQDFDDGFPDPVLNKDIVTTNNDPQLPNTATEPYDAVDNYPWRTEYLNFGVDSGFESEVWNDVGPADYNWTRRLEWVVYALPESQIEIGRYAFGTQSFEIFTWEGAEYAAYVVLDDGGDPTHPDGRLPYAYNGEIWVQKLDDPTVNCAVSFGGGGVPPPEQPRKMSRFEPEPIVREDAGGVERVYIYYNAGPPNNDLTTHFLTTWRIAIVVDQQTFDNQCRLGDVYNY